MKHLFLTGLYSGLGDLASTTLVGLDGGLDDTDSDGLTHVTDGETTKRRVVSESLNAHGLRGNHLDDGSVTRLDELGVGLDGLASATVDLLEELGELAGNVGGVAVKDWCVTSTNLTRVVENNDLGVEGLSTLGGVVLGVTSNVSTTDLLDGDVLHVEADVVTGNTLNELFVVHLNGLDFSGDTSGSEGNDHAGLDDTGLDTADRYSSDTADLVDVLEGKTEGLVHGSLGGVDLIEGVEEDGSLVPRHVGGSVDHVITVPSGNGDELDLGGVVADLLEVSGQFTLDLVVSVLLVEDGGVVHLVDGNDHLTDTHGLGKESVLTGLTLGGETSLELTTAGGDHEDSGISLGGTSDHVLDEISVAGGINDGVDTLGGLELPESNIDGDTTIALSLKLVHNPCVLEGTLTALVGLLLELLDGSGIDTTALVDQVTGGGGFAGIDVTNDDQVKTVLLFLLSNNICHV